MGEGPNRTGWDGELDNISSGPSLSFEIEIGDGPGPKLDNFCLFSHADASLLITHPAYDMWVRGGDTC